MFRNRKFCSLFLIFFITGSIFGQEEKKAIPLKLVLDNVASQHGIRFSYIEDEIVVYSLIPPPNSLSLKKKIDYLKDETRLKFEKINNKYFSIYNDKKLDKPLCGYLFDAETGKAIENASVIIINTAVETASDAGGYFELPKVSPNTIRISHQGYGKLELSPEDLYISACPPIRLQPISMQLEEVVARRYLTTGISRTEGGIFRIKPQKFGILPGLTEPDVLQTMQQIPGIYSADESVSNLNVRGGTHDQNLFLWNGIRMFQTGHFFGLISGFNPSLAQTVSITKNGSSAFFGESVSSLVDISSQTTADAEGSHSIGLNMINAEGYSHLKLSETGSLTFSGRRSITDIVSSPTYQKYRERIFQNTIATNPGGTPISNDEEFYFYDFTAQYQQKVGRSELNADFIGIRNSLAIAQASETAESRSRLGQENFGGGISWKTHWKPGHATEAQGYVSYYDLKSRNESVISGQILDQRNTVLGLGFRLKSSHSLTKTLNIAIGYQFDETGVTSFDEINLPFFSRTVTEVLRSHAVIGEGIFRPENEKVFLKAGIRINYFEQLDLILAEPRLQLNYFISDKWMMEILGERKSQTLSQIIDLQQDFLGIEKRRYVLSDGGDVPVQKSAQVSIGFTYKSNNWLLSIDNFYKDVDGITSASQGFQNQFEFLDASGSYRVMGSEVLIQKNFGRFYTWLSYSYNNNEYTFDGFRPSQFQNNFQLEHAVSWAGIYEWKRLKIALGSRWHSGRPYTAAIGIDESVPGNTEIIYGVPNAQLLEDYLQVNFSLSKQWRLGPEVNLQAGISVLNVLNNRNVINRFYRIAESGQIRQANTYSLERTPNVNLRITF
ncbi:MAG TPA: carboxypeptidase-like regulatory domain-containing protein [Flavobacterium sp.]|jgi:hypothetical protein